MAGPRPRPVPMPPVIIRPPADRILARVAPALGRIGMTDALAIGGGTALAARWNHRRSTDIDMVMEPESFRAAAAPLTRLLTEGAGTQIRQGRGWFNAMLPDGDFSITTAEALLADDGPPERESVFGLALESTAQILARKLRYRMWGNGEFVARDLYDLCTGAVRDPNAVARALDVLDPYARTALADEIARLGPRVARMGRALTAVDHPEWLVDLGRTAARLIAEGPRPTSPSAPRTTSAADLRARGAEREGLAESDLSPADPDDSPSLDPF